MSESHDGTATVRELDTSRSEPAVQVAEIVASLENESADELEPVYDQIDHVLSHIFSDPPDDSANIEITFTYDDYRIKVEQNGTAKFVRSE